MTIPASSIECSVCLDHIRHLRACLDGIMYLTIQYQEQDKAIDFEVFRFPTAGLIEEFINYSESPGIDTEIEAAKEEINFLQSLQSIKKLTDCAQNEKAVNHLTKNNPNLTFVFQKVLNNSEIDSQEISDIFQAIEQIRYEIDDKSHYLQLLEESKHLNDLLSKQQRISSETAERLRTWLMSKPFLNTNEEFEMWQDFSDQYLSAVDSDYFYLNCLKKIPSDSALKQVQRSTEGLMQEIIDDLIVKLGDDAPCRPYGTTGPVVVE